MLGLEESFKKELIIREYCSLNEEQKLEYVSFLVTTLLAMLGDLKDLQEELGARIVGFESLDEMYDYLDINKEGYEE